MNFEGKVALITGGAQGLGKAVSKALLNTGMKVLICDIDESCAKSFMEEVSDTFEGKVIYQKCDVSCFEELKEIFIDRIELTLEEIWKVKSIILLLIKQNQPLEKLM